MDDTRWTPDTGPSQKLTMSTLCSGELKNNALSFKKQFIIYQSVCKTLISPHPLTTIFWKVWPWYFTLTLTDDLMLGTREKVLPQGIHIWNTKALSLTTQKLRSMLNSLVDKQGKGKTDRQGKSYVPSNLSIQGHRTNK